LLLSSLKFLNSKTAIDFPLFAATLWEEEERRHCHHQASRAETKTFRRRCGLVAALPVELGRCLMPVGSDVESPGKISATGKPASNSTMTSRSDQLIPSGETADKLDNAAGGMV
jgi:hypothetical protein